MLADKPSSVLIQSVPGAIRLLAIVTFPNGAKMATSKAMPVSFSKEMVMPMVC
eukprot:CAMPEP_0170188182 /NCGR_PEP_ID=MMETSP0040_2-20121228/43690_1 /TAXON_ID=641309 /ORGANISM="Lotharella oceanica, Strain CCMP622" /LENGTH=52 /DNA_ID=CAMNT_0010435411 /DNA_START=33 /DNA_END=191 /DNA_ORIENTATION=+